MLWCYICTLCFINISAIFANSERKYIVVGPGTIRSSFRYNVAVSLLHASDPCEIEVGIYGKNYNVTNAIDIQPMSTKIVEFQMPELEKDDYKLTVRGIAGIMAESTTDLVYHKFVPLILMQTDKATYKPGDLVRFRVLILDERTQPKEFSEPINILIKDSHKNRIKIWKNITLNQSGVFSGSLQLSEQTVLGSWIIEVFFNDDDVAETKRFEVKKYELPKFEVNIDAAKNIAVQDEVIKVVVWAKYTFGKPVKGKATISIALSGDEHLGIKKTILINGKGKVEFNLKQEVLNANQADDWSSLAYIITADVEEELSESVQSKSKQIMLHREYVVFEVLQKPTAFQTDEPIGVTIAVRHVDGSPVRDTSHSLRLHVNDLAFVSKLDENGLVSFNFTYPEAVDLQLKCTYLDVSKTIAYITAAKVDDKSLQLILNKKEYAVGRDVSIKVAWMEPISHFTYTITARGNIMQAATVNVTNEKCKTYVLKFKPTHDMIPRATILVQYIFDDKLRFKEENIQFAKEFRNTLKISTVSQASPGDDVELQISTDPHSYVGLLAVDQSVLLLKNDNDLSAHEIFRRLEKYNTQVPQSYNRLINYPGKLSGLVTLTNAKYPFSFPSKRLKTQFGSIAAATNFHQMNYDLELAEVRKNFDEIWIFEDLSTTNKTSINFTKRLPDTLTSWVITGFSLNSKTGIALTQKPTMLKAFKPFFITVYLPYSVKKGEIISIPVLIFNYLPQTLEAEVLMYNSDNEYDFTDAVNDVEEHSNTETTRSKCISIAANSTASVSFMIKPKIVGAVKIKINALTAIAGDGIQQTLKVEPEGETQFINNAFFINLNGEGAQESDTITIDIPDDAVPNSEHIEISAIGDLVGLTIKNIENLVRLPFGYTEQNMIDFVPSILVLEYIQTVKQSLPNVTADAIRMLRLGLQSELKFKLFDGSFAASEHDQSGSTWLTAYIVRSFQQASKFIYIDPDLITQGLTFLASQQTAHGNFAEFGQLVNTSYSNDVAFSAFVLLAFLEHKNTNNASNYRAYIEKGVHFLLEYKDNTDDIQALSIIALVLQEVHHPLADEVLNKLIAIAKNENGYMWWSNGLKTPKRKDSLHHITDIEITSYILQAMLTKGYTADVLPIVKWLIRQRNSNGGFDSTQDTVVGLQALIKFAKTAGLKHSGWMNIEYLCETNEKETNGTISITPDNYMILNTYTLPKNTRQIQFTAKGNTSALLQLSYQYNIVSRKLEPSFNLSLTIRKNMPPKRLGIDVCVTFVPTDIDVEGNRTNLVVITAALPSGYTANERELDNLRDFRTILFTETKNLNSIAIIYLKGLEVNKPKCISIDATRTHEVAKQKPVPVSIYDYYDKERSATEYYEIATSLCDICEDNECGDGCKSTKKSSNSPSNFCRPKKEQTA